MTHTSIVERTAAYVRENFLYMRPDVEITSDARLLERGIIDSLGVMELVSCLEQNFGVRLDDDSITEENLGTLDAIATFVLSQNAASPVA